jgi:methylmalonyl-CoA/ethylmalonyl-CoA epimerase
MGIPFQRKLAQVAIAVKDIEEARMRFAEMLGVEPPEIIVTEPGSQRNLTYMGKPSDARAKLAFFDLGGVQLELIEPIGEESAWAEGLDEKGERVHHLAFWTEDMKAAAEYLGDHGAPLVMRGDMGENGQYAYFDGQHPFGCYIELLERNRTIL